MNQGIKVNINQHNENTVTIKGIKDFRLAHILECGQCFRWEREGNGSYTVLAGDRVVNLRETYRQMADEAGEEGKDTAGLTIGDCGGGDLVISNCGGDEAEQFWHHYLDMDRDYGQIKKTLLDCDTSLHMKEAVAYGGGMRILRQEPWEAILSFIISQNNNIKRIQKCIESLCEAFGRPLGKYRGKERWGFPSAAALAGLSEKDLAECRLGYRAGYIIGTAQKIVENGEERLQTLGQEDLPVILSYLQGLPGVGPKVANCIALFGFGRYESFPIDVWVKKAMSSLYGLDEKKPAAMAAFAAKTYGNLGGFAQQYLFYYIREKKERGPSC